MIDFLRGDGDADRIEMEIKTGRLCTTVISAFELWGGSGSRRQVAMVESLLAAVTILPVNHPDARRAGEI